MTADPRLEQLKKLVEGVKKAGNPKAKKDAMLKLMLFIDKAKKGG